MELDQIMERINRLENLAVSLLVDLRKQLIEIKEEIKV